MWNRRQFLARTLQGSSLLALNAVVPQFIFRSAQAATPGKDTILVVLEMTGGNDGLNTVIPHADDLYHKARPTLRQTDRTVIRLNDQVGLHPGLQGLRPLWDQGTLAVVQGVGYPNPIRSHFESMDVWHTGTLQQASKTGWLGRASAEIDNGSGAVPILHLGPNGQPLALAGAPAGGAVTVNQDNAFQLDLGGSETERRKGRRKLLEDLAGSPHDSNDGEHAENLVSFVQRRQLQTLTAVEQLRALLEAAGAKFKQGYGLSQRLQIIAGLIEKGFGTRIFYVSLDGFDTHSAQESTHQNLLSDLSDSIYRFFETLKSTGHDERVKLLTFSEFGRRVKENDSRGTDHGAGSCLFVAGPSVRGGVVGNHPSLADLDDGDLKYHTDFRSIYATLLDDWLGCDSKAVLGQRWDHLAPLGSKA